MTYITNPSNNGDGCHETRNTYQKVCNGYHRPPSRKKSDCNTDRHPSFHGCIELSVDKCRLAQKGKSPNGSKSKLCISQQSPRLKRSPNGSTSALCGSQPTSKSKHSNGMPSSCCPSHAPKLKKTLSSSSSKLCVSRKSSKQSIQGKKCGNSGDHWCDCRNLPTKKTDCDRKVCIVPGEGKYVRNEWWCDCRGVNKYSGKKLCVRPGPIIPKGHIQLADTALEGITTYKTDYNGKYAAPRPPILPRGHIHGKSGPMSSLTTQKTDYYPKPRSKRDPIYPRPNTVLSRRPMEGETTTKHDYQVPRGFIPSKSFRPIQECKPYMDPMQDETTQKADYVDWHSRGPQGPFPWTPGNKFIHPTIPMVGDTTYKTDYTTKGGDRRMPILPRSPGLGVFGNSFDDCTTYKHDYVPWECVNEYDYNAPPEMVKCYKMEGETPDDPDKKLWCYKSEDVCPYYPPKPIDGVIPGTTQYVVRPSEGERPCEAPKPPFNAKICDSEALLRISCPPAMDKYNSNNISGCQNENSYGQASQTAKHSSSTNYNAKDYSYSACQPCGSSKKETKQQNYNADPICATTNYNKPANQTCGPDNYDYSFNQACRPSKQEIKDYCQETKESCHTKAHYKTDPPCGYSKNETKQYNFNADPIHATTNYNTPVNEICGPDNYNYSFDQTCRPNKSETNYNHDTYQPCGKKDYSYSNNQPCGSAKQETKNYNPQQTCGFAARDSQPTYAPFQECSQTRQEVKAPLVANHHEPCCSSTTQSKPKETHKTSQSNSYFTTGPKYDQNCACMSQPTSRFTTQEERVLTVHC